MCKLRWPIPIALPFVLLMSATIAAAQADRIHMTLTKDGQPLAEVDIALVLANGNKLSAGITDTNGDASIALSLANLGKVRIEVEVEECADGKTDVYLVAPGATGQVPPPKKNCRRRRLVPVFLWDGNQHVTIDIVRDTIQVTHGERVAELPQGKPLISFQVGGGVGFKNFGGTSGERAAFLRTFPGGTFNTQANSFAGEVGTSMNVGPLVVASNLWRASSNTSNLGGPLQGGGADTAVITRQFQGIALTAGGRIPLGGKISFIVDGGGNFWHANIDTTETVANGTTTTTVTNSRDVDGRGWTVGGALQVDVSRRWSVVVRYDYLPMSNGGVNIHIHEGSVGVMVRLFGLPGK